MQGCAGEQAAALLLLRCPQNLRFSSAVRYENRKAMAQTRMRIKGQFAKCVDTEKVRGHVGGRRVHAGGLGGRRQGACRLVVDCAGMQAE